jgi:DNA polymerase III gamma/tau subunit
MRTGLKLLDQAASVGIASLGAWSKLSGGEDFAPSLVSAAAAGDHAALFAALDKVLLAHSDYPAITASLVACLRDVLVLQAGAAVRAQGDALAARSELAARLDKRRVVQAMRVLWDLQVRVRTEDRRSGLELAVVMVSEKLCPAVGDGHHNGNGHKPSPLTATDLASMPGFAPA